MLVKAHLDNYILFFIFLYKNIYYLYMSQNINNVRKTYEKVGLTSDTSSRIARLKAVQVRTNSNNSRSQLFGVKKDQVNGINGDSSQRTYFAAAFSNFRLN